MVNHIAKVVFSIPIDTAFEYLIDQPDKKNIGKRVKVVFGNKETIGIIVDITSNQSSKYDLKPILEILDLDTDSFLTDELFEIAKWMKSYYFCSLGEAIFGILPKITKISNRNIKDNFEDKISFKNTQKDFFLPTHYQQIAIDKINNSIINKEPKQYLLYGVAGSGKTEVYLNAIKTALAQGKSTIYLVPEISLTPQTLSRLKARFGDIVGILHSQMTDRAKFVVWNKILNNEIKILVGPRSAIFAPFKDLGVVIIDEEQDDSYKQDQKPNYDAREVAEFRIKYKNAVLISGTATPRIETFYEYQNTNKVEILNLPEKIFDNFQQNKITIIDMREELKRKNFSIFSNYLQNKIVEKLEKNEQILLFLNRRGESTYVFCRKCGYVMKCPNCDVSLVYHGDKEKLVCHYCGYTHPNVDVCPECKSGYIKYFGCAVQKVEKEIGRLFPNAKIARLDRDISSKKDKIFDIYNDFNENKIDILIGTQIITKGLDFPNLTLVGIISADTALNLADFRANERTFDILMQVIGRAGRADKKGEAILQTYYPKHYAIQAVQNSDFLGFYKQEIEWRKELNYPPFSRLVLMTFRSQDKKILNTETEKIFEILHNRLKNIENIELIGPYQPIIYKKNKNFRLQILIKILKDTQNIDKILNEILNMRMNNKVKLSLLVDPVNML